MNEAIEARRNKAMGKIVRQMREGRGLTLEALADLTGLHARTIQRVEAGDPAKPDTWEALAWEFAEGGKELRWQKIYNEGQSGESDEPTLYTSTVPEDLTSITVLGKTFYLTTDDVTVLEAGTPFSLLEQGEKQIQPVVYQNHAVRSDRGEEYPLKLTGQWIPLRNGARLSLLYCGNGKEIYPMWLLNHLEDRGWVSVTQSLLPTTFYALEQDLVLVLILTALGLVVSLCIAMWGGGAFSPMWLLIGAFAGLMCCLGRAQLRRIWVRGRLGKIVNRIEFKPT